MKKSFFVFLLPLFFFAWLPAQAQKTLAVATGNYKPFQFKDREGKLIGYDIELGNEIAKRLGVKFQWKQMDFRQIFPSLDDGSCRLAIAALHSTKAREKKYALSSWYLKTGLVVVARKTGKKIGSLDDLKGLTVAVKEKATGNDFARENGLKLGFKYKEYLSTEQSFAALKNGEVDAVFNDYLSSRIYLKENPDYLIPFPPFASCGLAIAAGKSSSALISRISAILGDLEKEGFLKKLYIKWLL
ncbi:amino acid ABC transporter substrate-binding protein [candidate division TA06 bacterium]|uniref:Amino acid ABC transporter substrate-binding protein n=1 Tax=candidate division TA06 bacterium TaxID=2250710 RepID=A0A933I9J6_UNCT6|nr:amino acid ABC transporter substrate-binding protein [candidate division TA06 bacterium]